MKYILPNKLNARRKLLVLLSKVQFSSVISYTLKPTNPTRTLWAFTIDTVAILCLLLIIGTNTPRIQKTISPIVASVQNFAAHSIQPAKNTNINSVQSSFSFVPGSVPNKYDRVDINGLNILSFFDIPVDGDGNLYTDSDGYQLINSGSAVNLFQSARQNNTKVLITLTQASKNDLLSLLDDTQAQQTLYSQTAEEVTIDGVDGIVIDFEYNGPQASQYRDRFTNFVKGFSEYMHRNVPGSIVGIALADNASEKGMYDVKALSEGTDKTLIMAMTFAVPETNDSGLVSPLHAPDSSDYNRTVGSAQGNFLAIVPQEKLVMERAWYGNGNNFNIYNTDTVLENYQASDNTLATPLSGQTIENLIADVPGNAKDAARRNLPYIADALKNEGILNPNVLAYALATIQHETADTFEPIDEYSGSKNARRLGYEGGANFYGRGFIQLTHLQNYKKMGQRIGMNDELIKHPDLASKPDVAAKILAAYFKDFGIAKLATEGNFYDARSLINPDYNAWSIAEIAMSFVYALA